MQSLSRLVSRLSVRRKRRGSSPVVQETRECQHDSDSSPSIPQQKQHYSTHRYSAPPQQLTAATTTTNDPVMRNEQPTNADISQSSSVNNNQPNATSQVNIDSLEFSASRDLAQSLGNEWNESSEQSDLIRFPALEHFLTSCSPPAPPCSTSQTTSQPLSQHGQVTKKPTRSRLSLHRHKSAVQLLKRAKSIPQMVA
ncbi:hypothetical protein K492DRAFT_190609 [Lichtheimia hyalospora FSU 10163]|nr:hypothetical protein K492DRAFT_190609 [Lichtheimia hyalospora FSU 10163]